MGFLSWMMNPVMLGAGALAVSLPIIIHLLNKRRFKIVNWAAMDFLLEADKQNRRRVQLQNLILLMLRCLAMLLLGLLLARPLLPSAVSRLLQDKEKFERIVVLDDSLSQRVLIENAPAFDEARRAITDLLSDLAVAGESDNWFTLYVTSNLEQPLIANEPVTTETLAGIQETLDQLECSDRAADYSATLDQLRRYVLGQKAGTGRVVYFFSDMRRQDWLAQDGTGSVTAEASVGESSPQNLIKQIGEEITQGFIVDCGSPNDQNLAVVDLACPDLLVANRLVRFDARIANLGTETASNVRVLLQLNETAPIYETIPSLAPGQTEVVTFRKLFARPERDNLRIDGLDSLGGVTPRTDYRVRVEIDRQSLTTAQLQNDQLAEDDQRLFAARVLDNIPMLLVDGDPSPVSERSETHYVKFLRVFGTGLSTEVISANELETIPLTNYRVLFLCNIDEVSEDRERTIEQWVSEGGALVILPGNQVRADTFNQTFYRDGKGVSPLALESVVGDPTMSSWVNFEMSPQVHPALRTLVEHDIVSDLLDVEIFSWWTSILPESEVPVAVPLRFNDKDNSAAMVERSWGRGKVVVFTIPADGDWTMWPGKGAGAVFVPMMLDLMDYLVGGESERSAIALGDPIEYPVDLTAFESRVWMRDAQNEKVEAVARPIDDTEQAKQSSLYKVQFPSVERTGFYEVGLVRNSGETETTLFAANSPASESNLKRMDLESLPKDFWGPKFQRLELTGLLGQSVQGDMTEFWPIVVWIILILLALEQFLGWSFGRNR
jgi:hypothetical protein